MSPAPTRPALTSGPTLAGGGNRLWSVDVELRGPFERARLDCGGDGHTWILGPLTKGEQRVLAVPVPARSPLGSAGLTALPLPAVTLEPLDSAGACTVLCWSAEQPAEVLERQAGELLARPRPPVPSSEARAGLPELLVLALAFLCLLRWRRRILASLATALVAGALAYLLARGRGGGAHEVLLLELDSRLPAALLVRGARAELPVTGRRLEVLPAEVALALELSLVGGHGLGARASGATLHALELREAPLLSPDGNGWEALDTVWTRSPGGAWRERGSWPAGLPLPAVRGDSAPPGWLASGLAVSRGALLARVSKHSWVRFVGFEVPGASGD